jgi:hypothetical protein
MDRSVPFPGCMGDREATLQSLGRTGTIGVRNVIMRGQLISVRLFNCGWSCKRTFSNELCTFNEVSL